MTRDNSPTYREGWAHGEADAKAASECPPAPEIGRNPPYPDRRRMYDLGYSEAYAQVNPCPCDGSCKGRRK